MLELSTDAGGGGAEKEKRLRGGGGRAHSFFLPPLRPLESFLFFPMAMRGKYAGGPSLAGTQFLARTRPTSARSSLTLPVKCADATQRGEYRKPIASRLGAPLRSPNSATPQLFKMVRPLPHPYSRHWLRTPRCRSDTRRVRPATATQHAQPILLPAATRSCPPAVRGLALPSLTGLPPPRRSTSPSPSCRRSSPSRGTSARCPSSRTSTTASRR